ncbi:MAG: hypothetical protein LBL48_10480, partial [Azoarcus sp.]|nr:hypothetical protein [Azoarcus sp.]
RGNSNVLAIRVERNPTCRRIGRLSHHKPPFVVQTGKAGNSSKNPVWPRQRQTGKHCLAVIHCAKHKPEDYLIGL